MSAETSRKLTIDWPEFVSYDLSNDRIASYYSEREGVKKKRGSIFYEKRLLDIFLFAMAIGKQKGYGTVLEKKSRSMPTSALREEEIWLMTSIALAEKGTDLDILTKPEEIVKICEEYANTGINTLITLDYNTSLSDPLQPYEKFFEEILRNTSNV